MRGAKICARPGLVFEIPTEGVNVSTKLAVTTCDFPLAKREFRGAAKNQMRMGMMM